MKRTAHIVVGLQFGDEGKGHVVDWLVRQSGARLVVRSNGGAQAGHTVVCGDGRWHTFSQLASGSFVDGVRTFLAEQVVVHPTALAVEAAVLASKGVRDVLSRVIVDERCLVTTPYHQAANRLRELARRDDRHGSCGVGFGETVDDAIAHPGETITFGELRDPARVRTTLARVRERKRAEVGGLVDRSVALASDELRMLEDPGVADAWIDRACAVARSVEIAGPDWRPPEAGDLVFEGAQGVLLDETHGFHPHVTRSTCTFANADAVLDAWGLEAERHRVGVLRTYIVRHGPGPLPTETTELDVLDEPHNASGPWQGHVRRGWLDLALLRAAFEAVGHVDALVLTHMDALARNLDWRVAIDRAGPLRESPELATMGGVDLGFRPWARSYGPRGSDIRRE